MTPSDKNVNKAFSESPKIVGTDQDISITNWGIPVKLSVITRFDKLCQTLYFSPPQACTFKMFVHLPLKIEQCSALFSS